MPPPMSVPHTGSLCRPLNLVTETTMHEGLWAGIERELPRASPMDSMGLPPRAAAQCFTLGGGIAKQRPLLHSWRGIAALIK
jgi:hypothetical protein